MVEPKSLICNICGRERETQNIAVYPTPVALMSGAKVSESARYCLDCPECGLGASRILISRYGSGGPLEDEEAGLLIPPSLDGLKLNRRGRDYYITDFGPDAKANADALSRAGLGYLLSEDPQAYTMLRLALRHLVHISGATSPESLLCARHVARALMLEGRHRVAADLLNAVYQWRQQLKLDDDDTLLVLNDLVVALLDAGDVDSPLSLVLPALEASHARHGPTAEQTLMLKNLLASAYQERQSYGTSKQIWQEVLDARVKLKGERDEQALTSMNNLAAACEALGLFHEANDLQEKVLTGRQATLPADSFDTITAMANLATTLGRLGEYDRMLMYERQVLEDRKRLQKEDHPDTLKAMQNLAVSLRDMGEIHEAVTLASQVFEKRRDLGLGDHSVTVKGQIILADFLRESDEIDRARELLEDALPRLERKLGAGTPSWLTAKASLAAIRFKQGMITEAIDTQKEVIEGRQETLGPNHWETLRDRNDLATMLQRSGDLEAARRIYEDVFLRSVDATGSTSPDSLTARINWAEAFYEIGDKEAAIDHATFVANTLASSPRFYANAYDLAVIAFKLLTKSGTVVRLKDNFAKVSARMCHALELRSRRSLGTSQRAFREFHALWQEFCNQYSLEELPRALAASQGLEASSVFAAILSADAAPDQPASRERKAVNEARVKLSRIRTVIDQMDAKLSRLMAQGNGARNKPNDLLLYMRGEREKLGQQESALAREYEDAAQLLARVDSTFAAMARMPVPTTTELQPQLEPGQVIILLWRLRDQCFATTISATSANSVPLPDLPAALLLTERYEAAMAGMMRCWRRGNLEEDPSGDDPKHEIHPSRSVDIGQVEAAWRDAFWRPVMEAVPAARDCLVVTAPDLHSAVVEAGNPEISARYFSGLAGFLRLWNSPRKLRDAPTPAVDIIADACWNRSPIPFVEVEARLASEVLAESRLVNGDELLRATDHGVSSSQCFLVACHGAVRGVAGHRYPVLLIDGAKGLEFDPATAGGINGTVCEVYLSTCVGGVVSSVASGDALGIVSALQLRGVGAVVASATPIPDFYMPLLSACYWHARRSGAPAHSALRLGKSHLRTGNWPEELLEPVRRAYRDQVAEVLRRLRAGPVLGPKGDAPYDALHTSLSGWLWPTDLAGLPATELTRLVADPKRLPELLLHLCPTTDQLSIIAAQIANNLVDQRHRLPISQLAHLCAFVVCYG